MKEIAKAQIAADDLEGAAHTINNLRVDKLTKGPSLAGLAKAQARSGMQVEARATCLKCVELLNKRGDDKRNDAFVVLDEQAARSAVAEALVEAGDIDTALEIIGSMPEPTDKSFAFRMIALHSLEARDSHGALRFARMIPDDDLKSGVFAEIAEGQAKAGEAEGAIQWAAQLEGLKLRVECLKATIPPTTDEKPKAAAF